MMRESTDSVTKALKNLIVEWNAFWFEPRSTLDAAIIRIVVSFWCLLYTISWISDLPRVVQNGGLFDKELTRYLIGHNIAGTGSAGRLSLLFFVQSDWAVYLYLFVTCSVTILLIMGIGGRTIAFLNALLILGIAHRIPMLQGPGELLIMGMVLYLIVDPGKITDWFRIGADDRQSRRSANLVMRLFQVHTILWLSICFFSYIAEGMWWNGTALWWLAIAERSPIWDASYLSDKPDLVSWISHAYLGLLGITIVSLTKRNWRFIGLFTGGLLAVLTFLMAGDWLLSLAILCSLSSFVGKSPVSDLTSGIEQTAKEGREARMREGGPKSRKNAPFRKSIDSSG
jgi:hypothetical protein